MWGGLFRGINLDHKLYWHDEVVTSGRIAGYTGAEFAQQVFDGHLVSVDELQHFQRLTPDKGVGDLLHSLATEAPVHPPLYYSAGTRLGPGVGEFQWWRPGVCPC